LAVFTLNKTFLLCMSCHSQQEIVISVGAEQTNGFAVQADLRPGDDLKELFKGANAGQGNETA
jgi:hypothetical protein